MIRNICIERSRELKTNLLEEPYEFIDSYASGDSSQVSRIAINQELERLEKVMTMYHQQRKKLEFCLKVLYRIPITEDDIIDLCIDLPETETNAMIKLFYDSGVEYSKQVYKPLTVFFNHIEHKENIPDALRKWLKLRIDGMISLMNGNPRRAWYNEESFQILMERYFAEKVNNYYEKPIFIALERISS